MIISYVAVTSGWVWGGATAGLLCGWMRIWSAERVQSRAPSVNGDLTTRYIPLYINPHAHSTFCAFLCFSVLFCTFLRFSALFCAFLRFSATPANKCLLSSDSFSVVQVEIWMIGYTPSLQVSGPVAVSVAVAVAVAEAAAVVAVAAAAAAANGPKLVLLLVLLSVSDSFHSEFSFHGPRDGGRQSRRSQSQ